MLTPIHLFIILTPIGLPQDAGGNMLFQAVLGVTPECAVSENWVLGVVSGSVCALTPIGLPYMDGNMLFQAVLGVTPECRNWVCSHQYSIGIS